MKRVAVLLQWALIALLILTIASPASAVSGGGYQAGFKLWRGTEGGFGGRTLSGVSLASYRAPGETTLGPVLMLNFATVADGVDPYPPLGYNGHNFYNGGTFVVGEATSPELVTGFAFNEAIASWNADTPDGSWIETL
ncbi:MAG: hypothetical protein EHM39_14645, partial [Chloroflexi bacterium]